MFFLLQQINAMRDHLDAKIETKFNKLDEKIDGVESTLRNEIRATNERIDTTNGRITSGITINLAAIGVAITFLSWLLLMK